MFRFLAAVSVLVWGQTALAGNEFHIFPGEGAEEQLQEALILAQPGDTIILADGVYDIRNGLSLDNSDVTIVGQGMNRSILSFKNQSGGAEGLLITAGGVILKDFAVEDSKGDAIKIKGVDGIAIVRVRAEWTNGPDENNGAYGLYPVQTKNVYIDGAVAIGASDAGIYVGQSENIIVRNSRGEYNVAGLEIENSYYADVYANELTNNTGGILIFDLPNLPQQGGHHVRVFDNKSYGNNTDNFAPQGNIVGLVPRGTGMLIMANSDVEVFGNDMRDNDTVNVAIMSYVEGFEDENYNPTPRRIHIHDNVFGASGGNPDTSEFAAIITDAFGGPLPNIVWDGVMPLANFFLWGIEDGGRHSIHDNVFEANPPFGNANLITYFAARWFHKPSLSMKDASETYPSLPPVSVVIRGVDVDDQTF